MKPRFNRALGALLFIACQGASTTQSSAQSSSTIPTTTTQVNASRRTAITEAVARVAPSVVTVQTEVVERVPADVFEQFFGGRSGQRAAAGLGSGFIVRADGAILTNAHVVAGATRISVAMKDGTTYPARLLGIDETNDLAVLKIDARNLPVAPLGSSSDLLIGEWTIAIGNPYGFLLANSEPSVTVGVVSGVGRNLAAQSEGAGVYVDMIQTDASINPGNSGGPLVNAAGEVIGVNSSIFSPSGGSIGLGFAIPINRARRVAEDLLAHGVVRRPWVGLQPQIARAATPEGTRGATNGVVVGSVVPGSPAAKAGIHPGDVLLRSRNRTLHNPYDWYAELLELRVGENDTLLVKRGSREIPISVQVVDLPDVNAPRVTVLREIELITLTPQIRAQYQVQSRQGALVNRVSDRIQQQIGLAAGDVIVQINRTPIATAEDVNRILTSYGRGALRMYFERGGQIYATEFSLQ
ncbi:MAG TPA: trypsin-like peptidase domain-containing protein [Gemmatimonadaceae bacterium]|jgi:serine protease Do|nr:trypsin-like peptidase domain-containing protein [Gemmatimonadaceae bacterium]